MYVCVRRRGESVRGEGEGLDGLGEGLVVVAIVVQHSLAVQDDLAHWIDIKFLFSVFPAGQ